MSVLSKQSIIELMDKSDLIIDGDKKNVGAAYYELRMGTEYYDLTEGVSAIQLSFNQKVIIKPGHRVVLITKEKLNLPNNLIARVISKGSLFSIGLSAVSTNADPGFSGNLGLVVQNFSDKYIELPQNEGIGKVDFSYLDECSISPYVGQHGYQTKTWPIKTQFQKNFNEVKNDSRVFTESDEAHKVLPAIVSASLIKIEGQQRKINIGLVFFLFINFFLLIAVNTKLFEPIVGLTVNLLTSLFVWLFMKFSK
ncbi:hypothetical protein H5154_14625 [Pseudoalteromonas sp. SR44-5]|uniref:dCTP deaminase domain-containing protein n=1 Tax=Pseudoalteromonas sp. SR44-5 TaxID=2760934 RepID=UPI0016005D81|nr:hypothetical protein [Pseudoalteromonas sp. SR44-5]MBB1367615.1 hypothetical protein [Pseudoalteromonas sp. SR44-5]